MNNKEKKELLSIAVEAARRAGTYLKDSIQSGSIVYIDEGKDIKIRADSVSENIILKFLKENSDFSILSEEQGITMRGGHNLTWVIDPLDGSLNYSRGIPLCCVSVGLWAEDSPILGVIYNFYRSELYTGIAGREAWINGEKIKASSVDKKENAVLCTGFPVNTDFSTESLMTFIRKVQKYKKVRLLGSAALSLAYVASGRVDAYMENDIMLWDVAGGLAIASGSGCLYNIKEGSKSNSVFIAVTNGKFNID